MFWFCLWLLDTTTGVSTTTPSKDCPASPDCGCHRGICTVLDQLGEVIHAVLWQAKPLLHNRRILTNFPAPSGSLEPVCFIATGEQPPSYRLSLGEDTASVQPSIILCTVWMVDTWRCDAIGTYATRSRYESEEPPPSFCTDWLLVLGVV